MKPFRAVLKYPEHTPKERYFDTLEDLASVVIDDTCETIHYGVTPQKLVNDEWIQISFEELMATQVIPIERKFRVLNVFTGDVGNLETFKDHIDDLLQVRYEPYILQVEIDGVWTLAHPTDIVRTFITDRKLANLIIWYGKMNPHA